MTISPTLIPHHAHMNTLLLDHDGSPDPNRAWRIAAIMGPAPATALANALLGGMDHGNSNPDCKPSFKLCC